MTSSFPNEGRYLVRIGRSVPRSTHGRAGSMGLLDRQEELHDGQARDPGVLQEGKKVHEVVHTIFFLAPIIYEIIVEHVGSLSIETCIYKP